MVTTQTMSDVDEGIVADSFVTEAVTENLDIGPGTERSRVAVRSQDPSARRRARQQTNRTYSPRRLDTARQDPFPIRWARKGLLVLSGSLGAAVVSTAALWAAAAITGIKATVILPLVAVALVIRVACNVARDFEEIPSLSPLRTRVRRVISRETEIAILLLAAVYIAGWPFSRFAAGFFLVTSLSLQVGRLLLTRLALRNLITLAGTDGNQTCQRHVIIVGTGIRARAVADAILESPESDTSVLGFLDYHRVGLWRYRDIPMLGDPQDLEQIVLTEHVDAVVLAVDMKDISRTWRLFATAEKMGVAIYFLPEIYNPCLATARLTWVNGSPGLVYRTAPVERFSLLAKAVTDRIGAIVGIALAAPLMLLAVVAIKLDSPGPVFFRQKRCGLNGKPFSLLKLRTMRCDAEKEKDKLQDLNVMSGPVFKVKNDPRVTKVGRVLRRCSIDEVPQFFNVLRGDMSLVGPRPPLPTEVAQYQPWQRRRLSVKPGVTCLWQVSGRNNIDFERWMELDLEYIDNWSLWLDTKILARTLPAVITGTGAS